jgi:hypothetical protein
MRPNCAKRQLGLLILAGARWTLANLKRLEEPQAAAVEQGGDEPWQPIHVPEQCADVGPGEDDRNALRQGSSCSSTAPSRNKLAARAWFCVDALTRQRVARSERKSTTSVRPSSSG